MFCFLKDIPPSPIETTTEPTKRPIKWTPRIISMPEPGYHYLGGNPSYKRCIKSYEALLKKIPFRRIDTNKDRGRILCLKLLREEYSREELATKNCSGKTRDKDRKITTIPQLDQDVMGAIFAQARHQFPEFKDIHTDHTCDTVKLINRACAEAKNSLWKTKGMIPW